MRRTRRHRRYQPPLRYDILSRVLTRVGIIRAVQRDDEEILTILGIDE